MKDDNYYLADGNQFYEADNKTTFRLSDAKRFNLNSALAKCRDMNTEGFRYRILRIEEV